MSAPLTVTLTGVPFGAALDTLLAIEMYAGRVYPDRAHDLEQQKGWNNLAAVVLPLRDAVDAAARSEGTAS